MARAKKGIWVMTCTSNNRQRKLRAGLSYRKWPDCWMLSNFWKKGEHFWKRRKTGQWASCARVSNLTRNINYDCGQYTSRCSTYSLINLVFICLLSISFLSFFFFVLSLLVSVLFFLFLFSLCENLVSWVKIFPQRSCFRLHVRPVYRASFLAIIMIASL